MTRLIDSHVHVWDRRRFSYGWLDDARSSSAAAGPEEYAQAAQDVDACVFVQAGADPGQGLAEARWVDGLGSSWPQLAAIVAEADLFARDLPLRLDALQRLGRLRGIRHLLQDLPDAAVGSAELVDGLRQVAARGLVFDVCLRWGQLAAFARVLEGVRTGVFVLDHLGKPPLAGDAASLRSWSEGIDRLAQMPNVVVKLSGLPAEAASATQLRERAPELLGSVIDRFGSGRCMVGSDWPVSPRSDGGVTTAEWFEIVRRAVGPAGWDSVAHATAEAVYRI